MNILKEIQCAQDKHGELFSYCLRDVKLTKELYEFIIGNYIIFVEDEKEGYLGKLFPPGLCDKYSMEDVRCLVRTISLLPEMIKLIEKSQQEDFPIYSCLNKYPTYSCLDKYIQECADILIKLKEPQNNKLTVEKKLEKIERLCKKWNWQKDTAFELHEGIMKIIKEKN